MQYYYMLQMLVNPLLEQLEESVSRNNEILDEIMM